LEMDLKILVVLCLVLLVSFVASGDVEDLLKDGNLDPQTFLDNFPKLADTMGSKMKTKVCQDQLKTLEKIVEKQGLEAFRGREQTMKSVCVISRDCVKQIVQVIKKLTVGGEEALNKMLDEYSGGLSKGMDLEVISVMYYNMVCTKDGSDEL